jgi:hypothetical protein
MAACDGPVQFHRVLNRIFSGGGKQMGEAASMRRETEGETTETRNRHAVSYCLTTTHMEETGIVKMGWGRGLQRHRKKDPVS